MIPYIPTKGIFSLLLCFLILSCPVREVNSNKPKKVLLFGDSVLKDSFKTINEEFANFGFIAIDGSKGGDNAFSARVRLEPLLVHTPDIVVIQFGINDSGIHTKQQFLRNMDTLLMIIRETVNCDVLVLTPTPIARTIRCKENPKRLHDNHLKEDFVYSLFVNSEYDKSLIPNIHFLDVGDILRKEKGILKEDKYHLNRKGKKILASSLSIKLKQIFKSKQY